MRPREAVFLGGCGQSGTSTLNRFLSTHPAILTCPLETSFLILPNGVMDVIRATSEEYAPYRLDGILHDFQRLMRHDLCAPRSYPFPRFDLASFFGRERYHQAIDRFLARLGVVRYRGDGLTVRSFMRIGGLHSPRRLKLVGLPAGLARERSYLYWSERQSRDAGLSAGRGLLDDLFGSKMRELGKSTWCEQTTTNQQFASFLLELCPSGLFVNVVRDPLDVALAHRAQIWAPDDFTMVCQGMAFLLERWLEVRARLPAGSLVEVSFEEMSSDPNHALQPVLAAIGVEAGGWTPTHRLDGSMLAQNRKQMRRPDLRTYRRILGPLAERLGYTVP